MVKKIVIAFLAPPAVVGGIVGLGLLIPRSPYSGSIIIAITTWALLSVAIYRGPWWTIKPKERR